MRSVLILIIVFAVSAAAARPARADAVQISETFRRVSKAVARDFAVAQLAKVCRGAKAHQELCEALTQELTTLVLSVTGEAPDLPALTERFRKTLQRALLAVAMAELHDWTAERLAAPLGAAGAGHAVAAVDCLAESVLARAGASCSALAKVAPSFAACRARTDPGEQSVCVLDAVAVSLGTQRIDASSDPSIATAVLQLQIAARLLGDVRRALVLDARLAGAVEAMFARITRFDDQLIASINSHGVFREDLIARAKAACAPEAAALARLQAARLVAYDAYARAIAAGRPLASVAPDLQLPIPAASPCDAKPEQAQYAPYQEWRRHAIGFVAHGHVSSALHAVELPMRVIATLIDSLRGVDVDLRAAALGLGLHAVRRQLGLAALVSACVERAPTLYECTRTDGAAFEVRVAPGTQRAPELIEALVESRRGTRPMEGNCLVQLATAVLARGEIARDPAGGAMCWLDRKATTPELAKLLGAPLTLSSKLAITTKPGTSPGRDLPSVFVWDPAAIVSDAPDAYRLAIAYRSAPERLRELVLGVLQAKLGAGDQLPPELLGAVGAILENASTEGRLLGAGVAAAAGAVLAQPIQRWLEQVYAAPCDRPAKHRTVCAMRALATVFFESAIGASLGSKADARFTDELVRRADRLRSIADESPFLFEIGLGFTSIGVYTEASDEYTEHFTVVDKWGLVARFGDTYVGPFAGGFLDAIVRDDNPRWLLGLTLGRRPGRAFPFGLAAHVAWAPAVDLDANMSAISLGLSLTLPTSYLLGN
jgi:hypothetical protein